MKTYTHKTGYEIRSDVLKIATDIIVASCKDHPDCINAERIIEVAKKLYSFVENEGRDQK